MNELSINVVAGSKTAVVPAGFDRIHYTVEDIGQFKRIAEPLVQIGAINPRLYSDILSCLNGNGSGSADVSDAAESYLGVKDAMRFLGNVSRSWLWAARKRGLPSHSLGGRVVFRASELSAYIMNS
ncbi:MAG: hypothetical protein A2020_03175 [Lentisphaerae bacterium GWF2_45_14]|nr:MAG: hypothetical protein A2020_03175 [Lentisphaerae bacterium GWF2_45_14]